MTMTDQASTASITTAAKELKLPIVSADAAQLAAQAQREGTTYLGYLAELLSAEVDGRRDRRQQRRIKQARFPRLKRLEDFDLDSAPAVNPATIAALTEGAT